MRKPSNDGIWNKLKKNRIALLAFVFVGFCTIASMTANLWIPDNSPDANQQFSNLNLQAPLTRVRFLVLEDGFSQNIETTFWEGFLRGYPDNRRYIHIEDYRIERDHLIVFNLQIGKEEKYSTKTLGISPEDNLTSEDIIAKHILSKTFWMGTDKYGRCVLSRLILGLRLSLSVGFLAVLVSIAIGIIIGLISGYFGGWIDRVCLYLINVTWSIPTLLLVFAIVLALGKGLWVIFLAVGLTMWVDVSRLVRGQTMKIKAEQYIDAARSLGYSDGRIMWYHILPNLVGPLLVIISANFASAILVEAGLSYLGFGISPPSPSLGNMLNENYGFALSGYWYLAVAPSFAIMGLVLALNSLSAGLRDATDVRLKE